MDKKHRTLITNTVMLYILTFSNYFFSFITIPLQTRILGPEFYGRLGFAAAFGTYFQLIMEYGFILSATEEVTRNKDNKKRLNVIYTSVTAAKLVLILGAYLLFQGIVNMFQTLRDESFLLNMYFWVYAFNALMPDFLYRGLENMRAITVRSVIIKFFFAVMILVFLRDSSQYYFIPIFTMIGNILAVIFVYIHIRSRLGIHFTHINKADVLKQLKHSGLFFWSRIATTIYTATNTFVIGLVYGNASPITGYYTSADKIISTAKQGITPITDSLYPHMVANRDYAFLKKLLKLFIPVIIAGTIVVDIFAEPICVLILGEKFAFSAVYLRAMSPLVLISFLVMTFGFPVLSPIGLSKYANLSVIIASLIHLTGLGVLIISGNITVISICVLTCITELSNFTIRLCIFMRYKRKTAKDGTYKKI